VELTGEGYFEVAHNEQQPFIVQRGEAEVQVLGTHFNINGYADEPSLKITLLEGRVMVKKAEKLVYLNPGQQAVTNPSEENIKVDYDVDTEEVVAWKPL
jgi:ferric-dicitrate binding protein FerR (iron transport regulator)